MQQQLPNNTHGIHQVTPDNECALKFKNLKGIKPSLGMADTTTVIAKTQHINCKTLGGTAVCPVTLKRAPCVRIPTGTSHHLFAVYPPLGVVL